ncbi:MAG: 4Fe-4S binding protein [Candidatus Marinimicrobia bacterium]|nr:4Fe-4S binding protein [Candidatus Neomarinimicrobiota bacterium]
MIDINEKLCDYCGTCVSVCPVDCIELFEAKIEIDNDKCIDCNLCVKICPLGALEVNDEN